MIISGILLGILLGLANFQLTSMLVKNIEAYKSRIGLLIAAKFLFGLFLVGAGIVFSWVYFDIHPIFLLLGLIIGRIFLFFRLARARC